MIYRLATPADVDTLARLRWDFRTEYTADPPPIPWEQFLEAMRVFLREAFGSGMWAVWVAEDEGQIVAQAFIQRIRKVPRPAALERYFGYVTNVYTRPAYRNQGVGAVLMRHVQDWAKQEQLEMLVLWPSEKAVPFYRRAGFIHPTEAMEFPIED